MTTTDVSGSRIFAELIHAHGVTHVFFVPAILREGLGELANLGVRSIATHAEKSAAYMADGYARVLGRPGICMAQTVGAANIAAGLKDAPWPPVYPKQPDEPPRVAPSRARKAPEG